MAERVAGTEAAASARGPRRDAGAAVRAMRWLAAMALAAGMSAAAAGQQDGIVATYLGTKDTAESAPEPAGIPAQRGEARPLATHATATAPAIRFNPAPVGIAAASAQTRTATFKVSGYSGSFTPAATLHYGLSYKAGTVACTHTVEGSETCTVPIAFQPAWPGGRRDALFLMDGSTRLATVLLYGVGEGPLALVQPGSLLNTINSTGNGNNSYFYQSVTDENGTVWSIGDNVGTLTSVAKDGVITLIPINGLSGPQAIGIDGAGVLYIALYSVQSTLTTYDTVQGKQGTFTLPARALFGTVGIGNTGNVYVADTENNILYTIKPDGSSSKVTLTNIASGQTNTPLSIAVDAAENLFFGGYWTINEYSAAGVQKEINPNPGKSGIAIDPAETLYVPFYQYGTAELLASDYATPSYTFRDTIYPFGISVGADGTASVGDYYSLLQYKRSQGALAFGGGAGVKSAAQIAGIYNGGNDSLTIGKISLTGPAFAMESVETDECKTGMVLAPGAGCQVAVTYTAPHAGAFTGALKFLTDSRNAANSLQTVSLSGTTNGVYIVASPAALDFAYQAIKTTSAPMTVTFTNDGFYTNASFYDPSSSNPAFSVALGTCVGNIVPGASCQVTVTFSPAAVQLYQGTVTVLAGQGASATFKVSGSAIPPIALAINEVIHVSDGAPALTPSTLLTIDEAIHTSDGTPGLTPSTILAIGEELHVSDGTPGLVLKP